MKKIIVLILLFFGFTAYSQEFKEVKTAQDVIDNYITASGGADAVKEIESIKMKGKIGEGDEAGSIDVYFSKKYIYMDISMKIFSMQQAIDVNKKSGWMKFGEMIKDLKEEDINKNLKNVEGSMWGNYLEPKEHGIKLEMMQNEAVNGSDCYVVDLVRDSAATTTAYFDTKTFMKVRELKGGMTNDFSDFKKVPGSDVIMPYGIKSPTGDVKITEIKFNSKFDKKLLKKPEVKEEKEDNK